MPHRPDPSPWFFPGPASFDPEDDLVAIGADMGPGTLLSAYEQGLFPMPSDEDPTGTVAPVTYWFCPVRRGVLPLDGLRVSRSLRRAARDFEIRVDTAFDEVLAACADPSRPHGWIDAGVQNAYRRLHLMGWAHSVEAWRDGELVGGLYGVAIGGLFAGESMFHRARDASKVALMGLVDLMNTAEPAGPRLLDVQWRTDHLASLGVVEISRAEYLARLTAALNTPLPAAFAGPED